MLLGRGNTFILQIIPCRSDRTQNAFMTTTEVLHVSLPEKKQHSGGV